MSGERQYQGMSRSDWLRHLPNALDDGGYGLNYLVPAGRAGFGLKGDELIFFCRLGLHLLIRKGGIPARGVQQGGRHRWEVVHDYVGDPNDIVDGYLRDWRASGVDLPPWGEFWFVTQDMLDAQKRRGGWSAVAPERVAVLKH
jgi:hypothetical protein